MAKVTGKSIYDAYNALYGEFNDASETDRSHFSKAYDIWIADIIGALKSGTAAKHLSLSKNYVGKKTKALMKVAKISKAKNLTDLQSQLRTFFNISEGKKSMKPKLKDLIKEHAWDHEFGQPLATITDVTAAHANKTLQESKDDPDVFADFVVRFLIGDRDTAIRYFKSVMKSGEFVTMEEPGTKEYNDQFARLRKNIASALKKG